MEYFAELAQTLRTRWQPRGYDTDLFPAIAAEALAAAPPHLHLDYRDVVRWVLSASSLPQQLDPSSKFGMPPVTVYRGDHFLIDVYFWHAGATGIHQHSFDGAFALLEGSSLHCSYAFDETAEYSQQLRGGTLRQTRVEVLRPGEPVPIPLGSPLIHSVFHLDDATVTVLARTTRSRPSGPTFSYVRPGLAFDAQSLLTDLQRKQIETLQYLAATDWETFHELLIEQLRSTDPWHAYFIVDGVRRLFAGKRDELRRVFAIVRERWGDLADRMTAAFMEDARRRCFEEAHAGSACAETCTALAALYMLEDRHDVTRVVRERHPEGDPERAIARALDALDPARSVGSSPPAARQLQ